MSIELPEAKILAEQMNRELRGKRIKSYHLQDYERLQKIGMLDKDTKGIIAEGNQNQKKNDRSNPAIWRFFNRMAASEPV